MLCSSPRLTVRAANRVLWTTYECSCLRRSLYESRARQQCGEVSEESVGVGRFDI